MTLINKTLRPIVSGIHNNFIDLISIVRDYKCISWFIGLFSLIVVDVLTYFLLNDLLAIPVVMTLIFFYIGLVYLVYLIK